MNPILPKLALAAAAAAVLFGLALAPAAAPIWQALDVKSSARRPARHAPRWVSVPRTKATTQDGLPITLAIAIDAPDATSRDQLAASPQQLQLQLQLVVNSMSQDELMAPDGMADLRRRMLARLRERVGDIQGDTVVRVRSVALVELTSRSD